MRYDIWNLGSSSEGNCFIVKHKDCKKALMLECGFNRNQFNKRFGFTSDIPFPSMVLISHEHQDHSKGWKDFEKLGCCVYSSAGTAKALGDKQNCIYKLRFQTWRTLSPFNTPFYEVFPLLAYHDATEPTMFLIRVIGSQDVLLFAIDTADIPYGLHQFNITDILVECNYSESDISPDMDPIRMERVRHSHMSLETLTDFFGNQKFPNLQQITLCHLSQSNCDPMKAKETIMATTGVPVRVCAAKGGFIGN